MLSETVSRALQLTGGREAPETAKFVEMMDKFFDSMNVHNYTEGVHKKGFKYPTQQAKTCVLGYVYIIDITHQQIH